MRDACRMMNPLLSLKKLRCIVAARGRLAQLVRAPALQAGGRRFEPCTAHHPSITSGSSSGRGRSSPWALERWYPSGFRGPREPVMARVVRSIFCPRTREPDQQHQHHDGGRNADENRRRAKQKIHVTHQATQVHSRLLARVACSRRAARPNSPRLRPVQYNLPRLPGLHCRKPLLKLIVAEPVCDYGRNIQPRLQQH
jgi:hypothetical protein